MEKPLLMRLDSVILDHAVKDMFKRVAGLDVTLSSVCTTNFQDLYSFVITTFGDYEMTIVLCADYRILHLMAKNMKHGAEPGGDDTVIYVSEFFNILCGHIISTLNIKNHCSARFSIPKLVKGHYVIARDREWAQESFYDCGCGIIKIEFLLFNSNSDNIGRIK